MTSTTTATTAAPLPTAAALEAALREALAPTQLEGANAEGRGTHFRVRIASPKFEGKPRVARHRLVYDALQVFIAQGLHAIAIEVL